MHPLGLKFEAVVQYIFMAQEDRFLVGANTLDIDSRRAPGAARQAERTNSWWVFGVHTFV